MTSTQQNCFFNFEKIMGEDKPEEDKMENYILNNILDDEDENVSTNGSSDGTNEL